MTHKLPAGNGKGNSSQKGGFPIGVEIGSKGTKVSVRRDPSDFLLKMCGLIEQALGPVLPVSVTIVPPGLNAKEIRWLSAVAATEEISNFVQGNLDSMHAASVSCFSVREALNTAAEGISVQHQAALQAVKGSVPAFRAAGERSRQADANLNAAKALAERAERQAGRARDAVDALQVKLRTSEPSYVIAYVNDEISELQASLSTLKGQLKDARARLPGLEAALSDISAKKKDAGEAQTGGRSLSKQAVKEMKKQAADNASRLNPLVEAAKKNLADANAGVAGFEASLLQLEGEIAAKQAFVELLERSNGGRASGRIRELKSELVLQGRLLEKEQETLSSRRAELASAQQEAEAAKEGLLEASASFHEAAKAALAPFESRALAAILNSIADFRSSLEIGGRDAASLIEKLKPEIYGEYALSAKAALEPARLFSSMSAELAPEFKKLEADAGAMLLSIERIRTATNDRRGLSAESALSMISEHEELAGRAAAFFPQCDGILSRTIAGFDALSKSYLEVMQIHTRLLQENAPSKQAEGQSTGSAQV
jgi:HAMP domain-containing protein